MDSFGIKIEKFHQNNQMLNYTVKSTCPFSLIETFDENIKNEHIDHENNNTDGLLVKPKIKSQKEYHYYKFELDKDFASDISTNNETDARTSSDYTHYPYDVKIEKNEEVLFSPIISQEYHYKAELNIDWNDEDNALVTNNTLELCNDTFLQTNVKPETETKLKKRAKLKIDFKHLEHQYSSTKSDQSIIEQTLKNVDINNSFPLIKRYCAKCDKSSEITRGTNHSKQYCPICNANLPFRCPICSKLYYKYSSIIYHLRSKCFPDETINCPHCLYTTTIKTQMQKHIRRLHNTRIDVSQAKSKTYRCNKCGKGYKYTWSLKRHVVEYCQKKIKDARCETCKKLYKNEYSLREHIRKYCGKNDREDLRCDHCDFKTKSKIELIQHLRYTHRTQSGLNDYVQPKKMRKT